MTSVCVIGVYVHDIDEALDFYCNKLGFKVKHVYDETCLIHLENDGPALILEKVKQPANTEYPGGSQIALGIETKNLEETVTRLKEQGVEFIHETPQEFAAGIYNAMRDPAGNVIELLQFKQR